MCLKKVKCVRYDEKKWKCDNCYFPKVVVKSKDNVTR